MNGGLSINASIASDKSFQRVDTELNGMGLGILPKLMLRFGELARDEKDYRATQIMTDKSRKLLAYNKEIENKI